MGAHTPIRPQTLTLGMAYRTRAAIEDELERLISLLDTFDGDEDLEDDDPAGDWLDERGEEPSSCGGELLSTRPLYGVDQSLGPINEREAHRQRRHELLQS